MAEPVGSFAKGTMDAQADPEHQVVDREEIRRAARLPYFLVQHLCAVARLLLQWTWLMALRRRDFTRDTCWRWRLGRLCTLRYRSRARLVRSATRATVFAERLQVKLTREHLMGQIGVSTMASNHYAIIFETKDSRTCKPMRRHDCKWSDRSLIEEVFPSMMTNVVISPGPTDMWGILPLLSQQRAARRRRESGTNPFVWRRLTHDAPDISRRIGTCLVVHHQVVHRRICHPTHRDTRPRIGTCHAVRRHQVVHRHLPPGPPGHTPAHRHLPRGASSPGRASAPATRPTGTRGRASAPATRCNVNSITCGHCVIGSHEERPSCAPFCRAHCLHRAVRFRCGRTGAAGITERAVPSSGPSPSTLRNLLRPATPNSDRVTAISHALQTSGEPIAQKARRLTPEKLKAVRYQFKVWCDEGTCRPSNSPWASPIHIVPKKTPGEFRICGDYRKLNAVTTPNKYPVPCIKDFTNILSGKSVFSTLDLHQAYNQIPMAPEDVPKTALITPIGLFEFLFMPFGLRNAAQTFQRFVNEALDTHDGRRQSLLKICKLKPLPERSSRRGSRATGHQKQLLQTKACNLTVSFLLVCASFLVLIKSGLLPIIPSPTASSSAGTGKNAIEVGHQLYPSYEK
ncbi:unnamed protein product, partial [Trichogramma brassicae]